MKQLCTTDEANKRNETMPNHWLRHHKGNLQTVGPIKCEHKMRKFYYLENLATIEMK